MLDLAERANIKIGCISMHTVTSFTNVSDCDYEGIGKYKQLRRLMDLSVSIYSPRSKFRYQGLLSILAISNWRFSFNYSFLIKKEELRHLDHLCYC